MAEDEALAKRLQAELDAENAKAVQSKRNIEVSDAELARRLQAEADLEAEFEAANQALDAKQAVDVKEGTGK
ncbi:hypothetical protein HYH02_001330 [Chlamydomonas schloesseri]|uniref:Uncharacterized protein n=1 Tax=Chlamydomonas schloesseri TaxID=2026947 RepID=A0A835WVA5_9CHLO|nr:hypothetical protein HYH02_001330 [Chlamydomonas schloesseri]|eukprot:KAG2454301.1 hypothetical protein HYH02_001330 [Chlamydomonas schloesseri]